MDQKKGILYIVATPIGNLEDMTLRAVRILKEVKLIAAEDTRHTRKLLNAYQIKTPMTSLHDWNEAQRSAFIIAELEKGHDVAYVSDAGTPGISDPGYILIHNAVAHSIRVVPVPGVCAAVAALSAAGLPMDSFVFYAFLPHREKKARELLQSLRDEERTMVFYESPRRLLRTLQIVAETMGDRQVVVARELTKVFEEIMRGSAGELLSILEGKEIKGEITLIIAGRGKSGTSSSEDELRDLFDRLRKNASLSTKDIVNEITGKTGLPRRFVYRRVLEMLKSR
ncbi:MAG: 16S rRNA (cytidine(1402)-2'-O)-methyltransferase [Syntrophales bacterium]